MTLARRCRRLTGKGTTVPDELRASKDRVELLTSYSGGVAPKRLGDENYSESKSKTARGPLRSDQRAVHVSQARVQVRIRTSHSPTVQTYNASPESGSSRTGAAVTVDPGTETGDDMRT